MGQGLYLQLFRNPPDSGRFCSDAAPEFNHHEGARGATASQCPLAGGTMSPAPIATPSASCWSGSSWAETRPPRLRHPHRVSTRPGCRVLAPADESDYVALLHLPSHLEAFPGRGSPGEREERALVQIWGTGEQG